MKELKHGDILPESFRNLFPEDVYELIIQISRQGFGLTLIGGAVRDFLNEGRLSQDLDFELRHSFEYPEEEWKKMIVRLSETLKNKHSYHVELLPFEIIKIKQGSFEVELSSPRTETYTGEPPFGHSEFEPVLNPNISYKESFERRDFTVNAIGIEFGVPGSDDEFKLIDPFNGIKDLKEKKLRPCGENFYKDPVRFIRMIRFSESLGFEFEGDLSKFDLTEFSIHYFFQEGLKNFFPIARSFFNVAKKEKIKLVIDLHDLAFLRHIDLGDYGYLSKDEVLIALTFLEEPPTIENRECYVRLSGMKASSAEDYESLSRNIRSLSKVSDSSLKNKLRHHNFVELLDDEELKRLQVLYKIYNRHRFGTLEILEKINPGIYERFIYFKNLFGDETKGKTVASKLMRLVSDKEKRSIIQIYCHLLVQFDLRPVLPESHFGN